MTVWTVGVGLAWSALHTPATQTGPLTVDEAVSVALRNGFALQLQSSDVEQARQNAIAAAAGLGPQVSGQIGVVGSNPALPAPSSVTGGLSVGLPIDVSGNLRRLVAGQRRNELSQRLTYAAVVNDTRLNVRTVFFNVQRAEALLEVQRQNVIEARERLRQARLLLENLQVARIDAERFDAQLAQATADELVAQNTLTLARQQFNFVLARPIETPVELVPVADLPPLPENPDALVATAQGTRPEVRALRESIEAVKLFTRAEEAGLNPSLNVGYDYRRTFDASGGTTPDRHVFSATVNVPIFDNGQTRARVRAARQNVVRAEINLRQLELAVSQDVRSAFANLTIARARLDAAQRQVALAEEVLRLSRIRQEAAAGTYVEVIDAQTQLVLARTNLTSARFDYLSAYAALQRGFGRDDLANATPETVAVPPALRPGEALGAVPPASRRGRS